MYLFILYVVILWIAGNGLGKRLLTEDHSLYPLRAVIGFGSLLAILQLGYYPLQLLRVSSTWVHLWTLIVMVPSLIDGCIHVRKEDFFFLKHWEFYVLLLLIFGVIKILPANEAGDDWFYMPLIMENASTSHINTIDPKTGWDWNVDGLYRYQGYYTFLSSIYRIQNTLFPSTDAIFLSFRVTMSLLFTIFAAITLIGFKKILDIQKRNPVFTLIEILAICLVGVLEWSHIYWGSFVVFPVMIPTCILLLRDYVLTHKKRNVYLMMILNMGMLALVSSALFLSVFLLFSFFVYELYQKKVNCKDYFMMLVPIFVYFCFFINLPWFIGLLVPMYVIFQRWESQIDQMAIKYIAKLIWLLPIFFFLAGVIGHLNFKWNIYRLGYTILAFNLIMCLLCGYLMYHKEKIDPILFVFLIYVIFFFNPLTAPFISHYLTTTIVYYRLFYITKNPIVIIMILYCVYQYCTKRKLLYYLFLTGLILLLGRYGMIIAQNTVLAPTYSTPYHYLLREDYDSRELGNYVQTLSKKEPIKILSIYFSPRQYNLNTRCKIYRYPNDPVHRDQLFHQVLYQKDEITQQQYIDFKNQMKRENYTHIIIFNNSMIAQRIAAFTEICYQNNTYMLLRIKRKGN